MPDCGVPLRKIALEKKRGTLPRHATLLKSSAVYNVTNEIPFVRSNFFFCFLDLAHEFWFVNKYISSTWRRKTLSTTLSIRTKRNVKYPLCYTSNGPCRKYRQIRQSNGVCPYSTCWSVSTSIGIFISTRKLFPEKIRVRYFSKPIVDNTPSGKLAIRFAE